LKYFSCIFIIILFITVESSPVFMRLRCHTLYKNKHNEQSSFLAFRYANDDVTTSSLYWISNYMSEKICPKISENQRQKRHQFTCELLAFSELLPVVRQKNFIIYPHYQWMNESINQLISQCSSAFSNIYTNYTIPFACGTQTAVINSCTALMQIFPPKTVRAVIAFQVRVTVPTSLLYVSYWYVNRWNEMLQSSSNHILTQWQIQKFWKGDRRQCLSPRRHLLQMHVMNCAWFWGKDLLQKMTRPDRGTGHCANIKSK